MAVNNSPEVKSLDALIGGSFQETLSKLSSSAQSIPSVTDFEILNNIDEFKLPIEEIARSAQCMLQTIGASTRFSGDIDGDGDWLVNVNHEILERVHAAMDEYKTSMAYSKIDVDAEKVAEHGKAKVSFHVSTIKKPQEEYNISVNNANSPFEHVWLEKSDDGLRFIHPLENISAMDFVDQNIGEMKPVKPLPLEETPFKLVEQVNDLKDLAAKLRIVEEFAVDLEHNQYRSFQGLTCLMQISTRTEDYVVDTFKLWDHIGTYLRDVFKDPKKKKVMHGADRDIIWLQRDFGIYVCNLFDTGQASRVLKLERKSLEFLLNHYCGVAANKQYQNADWRLRPLPDVMTRYAREDTHYLLYIYDLMRIDLHTMVKEDEQSDSPLIEVYKRSYDVCMQLYEKELLTENSYLHLYGVQAANFNAVQLAIVAGLCKWRDLIARADDESTGYVLPNKTLFEIAKEMPINVGKLRRLFKSKLPYVERNIDGVIGVIRQSMQNAAAFEPVVQSLETLRHGSVFNKNIETTIEETDTGSVASFPVESNTGGGSTTDMLDSRKVSLDVSMKQSGSFGVLPLKRKFEIGNKDNEEIKMSKLKPACVSKPDEVIMVSDDDDDDEDDDDDDDDETSETGDDGVSENNGLVREDEGMSRKSEKQQGRFMTSPKPGFLNF